MASQDNRTLAREALRALSNRLPGGWTAREAPLERVGPLALAFEIVGPNQSAATVMIEARASLDPKGARVLLDVLDEQPRRGPLVVVARYLSATTRERLRKGGVSYLDLTGNVRIVLSEPGLFIETHGASEDPDREERPARSLRGPKAGRVVRALIDNERPLGVRALAAQTKLDAGYVSRVLALLEKEALITRVDRGRTESVDWPSLLRRWANDAPLETRGTISKFLEPRGLSILLDRLTNSTDRYAVTGSLAAAAIAPIAPPRLAIIWMDDASAAALRLGLRQADAGANVLLVEPRDHIVFEGAHTSGGVCYAASSQVAADLLTSPGRGPAEGEELIGWMEKHEKEWRK